MSACLDDSPLASGVNEAVGFGQALWIALRQKPRQISPKWFYDQAGSALFERITELPEYYPTRTELRLLAQQATAMAPWVPAGAEVVEFGAGSARKVGAVLQAWPSVRAYVPVDISGEWLLGAASALKAVHPGLHVAPVVADFTVGLDLPVASGPRVGFYPGSSIGNFEPSQALALLRQMRQWLEGGPLLIGVDLIKDPAVLHAAYNDAQGVTAAFNRNLLARAQRELGAMVDPAAFAHSAFYNPTLQRIEMHLVSSRDQTLTLPHGEVRLAEGDSLHTESSYKYTLASFQTLAQHAGWRVRRSWTDAARWFSLHWLEAP
jgi:dimethylhistidine N-methyltransferase